MAIFRSRDDWQRISLPLRKLTVEQLQELLTEYELAHGLQVELGQESYRTYVGTIKMLREELGRRHSPGDQEQAAAIDALHGDL